MRLAVSDGARAGTDGLELVDYRLDPSALIFDLAGYGLSPVAAVAGFRIVGELGQAEDAAARLDRQAGVDLVALALGEADDMPEIDRLVDRIAGGARAGRFRAIILLPASLIDAVTARIEGDEAVLLVDPAPLDIAFALSLAAHPAAGPVLRDIGAEGGSLRLIELSEEVGRLARQLAALAGERPRSAAIAATPAPSAPPVAGEAAVGAATLRAMIRQRRVRDQFFRADLFADPAWDMLLDLAAARKEGRQVPVSSLCIAAAVPPTTALRWIRTLTDEGLLERRADPHDGRRVFVALSDAAAGAVDACVLAMRRAGAT